MTIAADGSNHMDESRWVRSAVVALLAMLAVGMARRFGLAAAGVDFFTDDGYYYANIARHVASDGRPTFDGITLTNGFHPLMLWMEAGLFAVLGAGATQGIQYVSVVVAAGVLFFATLGVILAGAWRSARSKEHGPGPFVLLLLAAGLMIPRFTALYLNGMESVLELPLLAGVIWSAWGSRWGSAGLFGALLALARLDTLPFLLAPMALLVGWSEWRAGRSPMAAFLKLTVPAAIALSGVMFWNLIEFGHLKPIHGALKSSFPAVNFQPGNFFGNAEERLGLRLSVLGSLAGILAWPIASRLPKRWAFTMVAAGALGLIQVAVLVLFQKWSKSTPPWYLAPLLPLAIMAGGLACAAALGPRALRLLAMLTVVGTLAANSAWVAGVSTPLGRVESASLPGSNMPRDSSRDVLSFILSRPASAVWAASDCGKAAFWTRRSFVNLDGLVNDFAYQEALRDQRLGKYLSDRGVRYLVFGVWDRSPTPGRVYEPMYTHRIAPDVFAGQYDSAEFYLYSHQYERYSDRVRLPRAAEVWRSAALPDGPVQAKLLVFDLSLAGLARNTLGQASP